MSNAEGKTHILKTHPLPYLAVWQGRKTFEFREDDRDYREGDTVVLVPWSAVENGRSEKSGIVARIGYVLSAPQYGIPEGFCVFSLLDMVRCPLLEIMPP